MCYSVIKLYSNEFFFFAISDLEKWLTRSEAEAFVDVEGQTVNRYNVDSADRKISNVIAFITTTFKISLPKTKVEYAQHSEGTHQVRIRRVPCRHNIGWVRINDKIDQETSKCKQIKIICSCHTIFFFQFF